MSIRPVIETRRASPHIEGAGVHLHRAFGFQDPTEADPFLLFDDFRGAGVPEGKKSMAYALTYRASDRTLSAEEVDAAHAKLVRKVSGAVGAELRS